jgi:hypothetical protein
MNSGTGCIAIAAVRETAEIIGQYMPEANWFLQNRTYAEGCMASDNDTEELLRISTQKSMDSNSKTTTCQGMTSRVASPGMY